MKQLIRVKKSSDFTEVVVMRDGVTVLATVLPNIRMEGILTRVAAELGSITVDGDTTSIEQEFDDGDE